jgi:hypothetical protein
MGRKNVMISRILFWRTGQYMNQRIVRNNQHSDCSSYSYVSFWRLFIPDNLHDTRSIAVLTQLLHNILQKNTINCCISLQHYTKYLPLRNAKQAICCGSSLCSMTGFISFSSRTRRLSRNLSAIAVRCKYFRVRSGEWRGKQWQMLGCFRTVQPQTVTNVRLLQDGATAHMTRQKHDLGEY